MPAPLVKGIIITLTLLTAIGAAALSNPQVRAWVEEQRRKIAEALHSLGDELDPQSRRQAEAFAFEGRIPSQRPESARRESAAARNAVARATGRETEIDLDETSRRLARVNSGSLVTRSQSLGEDEEAERRRLGREYLARRNAEMIEAKEKAKMRKSQVPLSSPAAELAGSDPTDDKAIEASAESSTPSTTQHIPDASNPWTFDSLLDQDGSLKAETIPQSETEKSLELPSPPTDQPRSFGKGKVAILDELPSFSEPLRSSYVSSAFDTGSRWSNPFGDEFELEDTGYATPKAQAPAVPPKIALDEDHEISVPEIEAPSNAIQLEAPVRHIPIQQDDGDEVVQTGIAVRNIPVGRDGRQSVPGALGNNDSELDNPQFEEELARALSLSTAEEDERIKRRIAAQRQQDEEDDLAAAIAASLAEEEKRTSKQQMTKKIQDKIDAAAHKRDGKITEAMAKVEEKVARAMTKTEGKASSKQLETAMLVDISPDPPASDSRQQHDTPAMSPWQEGVDDHDSLYDVSPEYTGRRASHFFNLSTDQRASSVHDDDSEGLYSLSPEFIASQSARLVTPLTLPGSEHRADKYDPVHEAATSNVSTEASSSASTTTAKPAVGVNAPPPMKQLLDDTSRAPFHQSLGIDHHDLQPGRPMTPSYRPDFVDFNGNLVPRDGARTPTTATPSPEIEKESIGFSTDGEDEFASAAASMSNSVGDMPPRTRSHESARRASTVSFTTDTAHNDFSETESLVGRSDAESVSLIGDSENEGDGRQGVESVMDDDDSSDDEWGSGVRTPGSEWTDVGSVVSDEEVGGQDESRLIRE